jgi:aryl-alcohol dehydrogenase-like predicted oxidoreductase
VRIERIALGCGNFGGIGSAPELFGQGESRDEAFALMDAAWELGIRRFDTADAYGGGRSETWVGDWMRERRRRPTLTTKVFHSVVGDPGDRGLAPERVRRQLHGSLQRLGVDAVDLYLTHEPDPEVPIARTLDAFQRLRDEGLVGAVGISNVSTSELGEALAVAQVDVVQNEHSLLRPEADETLALCVERHIAYQAFSPLAGGWLSGKYTREDQAPAGSRMAVRPGPYAAFRSERVFAGLDRFRAEAARRGVDVATLAFAWVLSDPRVTGIVVGPRRPEHLRPALAALGAPLAQDERFGLAALFYEPPVASTT